MSHVTNVCVIISRSVTQEVRVVTGRVSYWLLPFSFHSSCSCAFCFVLMFHPAAPYGTVSFGHPFSCHWLLVYAS